MVTRLPTTLLILLCASPVCSAFGLVGGGGGVWHASEGFQCVRHDCYGPHQQIVARGIRLPLCRGHFAFATRRTSRPPGTALFARPKTTDEEMENRKEQLRVLLSASKEKIDKVVRKNPSIIICSDIEKNRGPKLKLLQERLGTSKKAASQLCLKGNRLLDTKLPADGDLRH